ncbi:MAG: signal peptide peptidase SppA [Candidatus Diapherotrites archaeon]|nr:signal peptide peptidase SppA [Candidatus Diapherotrites archaeon]
MRVGKHLVSLFLLALLLLTLLFVILFFSNMGAVMEGGYVGVVPVKGELVTDTTDSFFGQTMGVRETIRELKNADDDPSVSVILLDINSGGGSVVASKELMRAVREAKKPVVAYIGDVGASGAYYVASAADSIVADEDSVTGSIGVVAMLPNYASLFKKIGVNMTILKEGKNKVMGNPYENLTSEQREIFQTIIQDAYKSFKENVIENRNGKISTDTFDSIADGRILNGRQALEYGLIDAVGSRELALEKAAELGGITGEPKEKVFAPSHSILSGLFGDIGYSVGKGFIDGLQENTPKLSAKVI